MTPDPDTHQPVPGACPATTADNCNENASSTDKGTAPQIKVTDLNGNLFAAGSSPVAGQAILVSAVDSSIPGGCTNGGTQFQFSKNGSVVQDWNSKSAYEDTPVEYSPTYKVQVRCSSDTTCTSLVGASVKVAIYDGINTDSDGGLTFGNTGVTYVGGTTRTTTLSLTPAGGAVDIYKGSVSTLGAGNGFVGLGPTWQHVNTTCFQNNSANPTPALDQTADPNPALSFCLDGTNPGTACTSNSQCVGTCSSGTNNNAVCNVNTTQCTGVCVGGTNPGVVCTNPGTQCLGGGVCSSAGCSTGGCMASIATFYSANTATPGVLNGALGLVQPSRCFGGPTPNVACFSSATCGAGGTCLNAASVNSSATPAAATACKP